MCSGSVSVLVNGSPTLEFPVERGLRQGDPLASFLFLIIVEGLAGIVKKSVELGYIKLVRNEVPFPILQYADDTLCVKSQERICGA